MNRWIGRFLDRRRHHPVSGGLEIFKYIGPGLLVTVGFIDPGNWASNLAAGAGLIGKPVVPVNLVPVVAVSLAVLQAVQLSDHTETVCHGLVGIAPLNLVKPGQIGMLTALCLEDFDVFLRSKYILHVSSSFRCF